MVRVYLSFTIALGGRARVSWVCLWLLVVVLCYTSATVTL
jgi:hypothetical protein